MTESKIYLPDAIEKIASKFEGWKFGTTNQGCSIDFYLEVGKKYWYEENGNFEIIEIAAYIKSEMAKRKSYISVEPNGKTSYWSEVEKHSWFTGPEYDPTNPEDEARAVIECAYMSLFGELK